MTIEFVAKAARRVPILCSEYCGNGHKDMTGDAHRPREAKRRSMKRFFLSTM